ncbi:uncharacterized protein [Salminus brasiliensis]|uniref:uncharacterized protein n=1 Tax=Salminus brasiliensis TaxID=930266 RepID=UPI003B830691
MESKMQLKRRKAKFSNKELDVLVEEMLKPESALNRRLPGRDRARAWRHIVNRVNSVAKSRRTLLEVKKRWYDVKRQRGRNIKIICNQMAVRLSGESDPYNMTKEEPLEVRLDEPDPQKTDRKLNGQLMPCVPVLKLEDIAFHISNTPLYSIDLEDPAECDSPHSNHQASPTAEAPGSPHTSELQDEPGPSIVLDVISAEMKHLNTACSAMLASSAQIASAVKELSRVIDSLNDQRRYFSQKMLESIESLTVILKKHGAV